MLLEEPTLSQAFQVKVILNLSTGDDFEVLSSILDFSISCILKETDNMQLSQHRLSITLVKLNNIYY